MHTTYHINHRGQRQLDSDSDHPSLSVRSTIVKKFRIKIQPEEPPSYSAEHHNAGTFIRSSTAAYATTMRWSTIMGLQQPSIKHAAHDEDLRLFFSCVCVKHLSCFLFVLCGCQHCSVCPLCSLANPKHAHVSPDAKCLGERACFRNWRYIMVQLPC